MNLSFAGCGFLGIYHVGVASCFREFAPALINKVAGASAGAIAGCCLVCNCCLGQAASDLLSVVRKAHEKTLGTMHPSFSVMYYLRDGLERLLPQDAHKLASGRLFISLTRASDNKNVIVSEYESREDLIQAVICSAFVPLWAGIKLPTYKGMVYIDGGITNNLPQIHEDTITVSPFSGESDICPDDKSSSLFVVKVSNTSIHFTLKNIYRLAHALFPPEVEVLADMCQQGFDDALKFLKKNDLISCAQCITLKSNMYLSSENNEYKKALIAKQRETRVRKLSRKISRVLQDSSEKHPEIKALLSECMTTSNNLPESSNTHNVTYCNSKNNDCYRDANLSDCNEIKGEPCHQYCPECKERMEIAVFQRLPPTVLKSLQKACESVNMGIFDYFYKLKIVKILSYLTLPWFVPLDLICVYCKRFLEWVPYLPSDIKWLIETIIQTCHSVLSKLSKKDESIATINCEMSISQLDYSENVLSPTAQHDSCGCRKISIIKPQITNTNVQFSVEVEKDSLPLGVLQNTSSTETGSEYQTLKHFASAFDKDNNQLHVVHAQYNLEDMDSFEQVLEVTNKMDSVLAFYYMDDQKRIAVREIFGSNDPQIKAELNYSERETNRRLSWDFYVETHNEELSDIDLSDIVLDFDSSL